MLPSDAPVNVIVYEQPPEAERRRTPRYPSDRLTLVLPESAGREPARPALARDVSTGGISLYLEWPYAPGTLLTVSAVNRPGPRLLTARVVHTVAEGEGWAHGCEWLEPLSAFELDTWQKRP